MHPDLFLILASMEIKPAWWKVAWLNNSHLPATQKHALYTNDTDLFYYHCYNVNIQRLVVFWEDFLAVDMEHNTWQHYYAGTTKSS